MVPKVFPSDLLTPDTHPIAILDAMAVKTPAKARSGLGSGLVDHSQKMTVAARATAEKKAMGQRS